MTKPTVAAQSASTEGKALQQRLQRAEAHQAQLEYAAFSCKLRKRPLVLFFGRESFSDNSKYLFLRSLSSCRGYEVLWCTPQREVARTLQARGLPTLLIGQNHEQTIDTLLHAAVAVFTINPFESLGLSIPLLGCLAGARKLQLWHGISVKKLNLQLLPPLPVRNADLRQYWLSNIGVDHVLSTSSHFDEYWRTVFGCRELVRAGMPRNEVIVRPAREPELLGSELPDRARNALESGKPAILLTPTWQRSKETALTDADFLTRIWGFARRNGANVFIKTHPTYVGRWEHPADEIEELHLIDPGVDLYPHLQRFAALITDYSSIMFDFLLTGHPVLTLDLRLGDHQNYEPDYSLVPPGDFRIAFTPETIEARLDDALSSDRGKQARAQYATRIFETDPAEAGTTLLRALDAWVEQSLAPDFRAHVY